MFGCAMPAQYIHEIAAPIERISLPICIPPVPRLMPIAHRDAVDESPLGKYR